MNRAHLDALTVAYATRKLRQCIRHARACSQDWRETKNACYRVIRDEAMADARYWRDMAKAHS